MQNTLTSLRWLTETSKFFLRMYSRLNSYFSIIATKLLLKKTITLPFNQQRSSLTSLIAVKLSNFTALQCCKEFLDELKVNN